MNTSSPCSRNAFLLLLPACASYPKNFRSIGGGGGGGGGPCSTGRGGVIGCGIGTGADSMEKILRPFPEYPSVSASFIHSGCSCGSRLANDPEIFVASCSVPAAAVGWALGLAG